MLNQRGLYFKDGWVRPSPKTISSINYLRPQLHPPNNYLRGSPFQSYPAWSWKDLKFIQVQSMWTHQPTGSIKRPKNRLRLPWASRGLEGAKVVGILWCPEWWLSNQNKDLHPWTLTYGWWFRNSIPNHLGCIKPCKSWDKLPTSTG